jgi:glycosyltransferase involved in cell wall biosynthesis
MSSSAANEEWARWSCERGGRRSTTRPVVSIIVPFRNAARWLRPCLRSLVAQDFGDGSFEIVAVDNDSCDGSGEIVREFPGVRLVHEPRVGSYSARNRGVEASRGSVFAFIDADCAAHPDWLRRLVEPLEDPSVDVVLGHREPAGGSSVLSLWSHYERVKQEFVFSGRDLDLYYGHTNNMAVRRPAFGDHGPFLERPRGSDTIFVRQVAEALGEGAVAFHPDARVRHLELTGWASLLRKLFIYGRSSVFYGRIVRARPLDSVERWRVYRSAVRRQQYSATESMILLALLVVGVVAWKSGSASALLLGERSAPRTGRGRCAVVAGRGARSIG